MNKKIKIFLIIFLLILSITLLIFFFIKDKNISLENNTQNEITQNKINPNIKTNKLNSLTENEKLFLKNKININFWDNILKDWNCYNEFNENDYNNYKTEDINFIVSLKNNCIKEQNKLKIENEKIIKERIESVKNFEIKNCETIAKEKYNFLLNNKNSSIEWLDYDSLVSEETKYCQIWYAWWKSCEIIPNKENKKYCEKLKEFQKMNFDLEKYNNFVIWTYLK